MSTSIDERVVAMKFNNAQFEQNIKQTQKSLIDLKNGLNLDGAKASLAGLADAGKNFTLGAIDQGVQGVSGKFVALAAVGIAALASIASQALATGKQVIDSLTIDPIKAGFAEYELKMGSIQTILANTSRYGTTLGEVTASLDDLNTYADKTIYNFGDMTKNIGLFTNAGIRIEDATSMIKGFSNAAAASGTTAQGAAGAAYQLSQALSAGKITLMDWKSLTNVGMGNKNMQTGVLEIATAMGTFEGKGTDATEAAANFNGSLEKGWLTADVMSNYLKIMAGDMDEATMASLGLSAATIATFKEQQATAQDAATKVRTFTQLMGTLRESVGSGWSQSFDMLLGDFDQATELFTNVNNVLGEMIGKTGDARNKLIEGWVELGGRDMAIKAISNAFEALMSIVKPIGEAMKQIFPSATAAQLANITKAILEFSEKLKMGAETAENLKRSAAGLFAVFGIVWEVLKGVVKMLFDLIGTATEGSSSILGFTGTIGDFLVSLHDAVKNGDGLNKFFEVLTNVIKAPINGFKAIIGFISEFIGSLRSIKVEGNPMAALEGFVDKLKERMSGLSGVADWFGERFGEIGKLIKSLSKLIAPFLEESMQRLTDFSEFLGDAFKKLDFDQVLAAINTGLFAGLVIIIGNFFRNLKKNAGPGIADTFKIMLGDIKDAFAGGDSILGSIKTVFGGLTSTLESMQQNLKAKTLVTIAAAIALLTASVVALSMIDTGKLTGALTAMTVMFTQLFGSMAIFEKLTSAASFKQMPLVAASMILLGVAINILASAVKSLAELDWNELAKGLTGVTVLMGILIGTAKVMEKEAAGMIATSFGLLLMAGAIKILASAVTDLAVLDWNELARGLVGVAGVLLAVVAFTQSVGNPAKIVSTSLALLLLGAALKILASALGDFSSLAWPDVILGLVGMAGALVIISKALKSLPKSIFVSGVALIAVAFALKLIAEAMGAFGSFSPGEIAQGLVMLAGSLFIIAGALSVMGGTLMGAAALVVAAAALNVMLPALIAFSSMSPGEIAQGLVMLAGSLAIIAGALYLMTGGLAGAAALIVTAGALAILAPVLVLLGGMSWEQIGTGLGALAATLGILAVAGIALVPAVIGLMGLGVAVALIGVGALAAGVGILAFSVGLTALAAAGSAALTMIGPAIQAFADQIPLIAAKIGEGVIAFAGVITAGAPAITEAFAAILLSLIEAVVSIIPPLVDALVQLITKLLEAIVTLTPLIVNAAIVLVTELLRAIVNLVPKIVDAGLKLVIGLLDGIAKNIPLIIQKGTDIIVALLDGIGKAIPRLMQAGVDLILDFINGLASTIRQNTAQFNAAGNNLAGAIIDGMTSGIRNGVNGVIKAITGVAGGAINAAKKALGIASPSKVFTSIGEFTTEGLANGILNLASTVGRAATKVGGVAITAITKSMSTLADVVNMEIDIEPTIRPVMDLSDVKKSSSEMDALFSNMTLSLDRVTSNAKAAEIGVDENKRATTDADGELTGGDHSTTFNQYNNSPKALLPAEIYRQTKNQLSVVKGELDK